MKQLLSLKNLLALLVCLLCALSASAYDYYTGGIYYYSEIDPDNGSQIAVVTYNDDNGTTYNSYSGYVTIPSSITIGGLHFIDIDVTQIGDNAFRSCGNLTGISMPTTIKTIGTWAFSYCHKLTNVTIPYSVTSIGFNAFGDCNTLATIHIGSGVQTIAAYGFDSPLTKIYVYANTPPTINNENAFKSSTYSNAELIVPDGKVSAYKSATYWSNFAHIRNFSAVPINATNFPDANFRSRLLELYPDGYIPDIDQVTSLNVAACSISNLQGIQLFTGLKELRCFNNPMTSLDVSALTQLTFLDCAPTSNYTGTKLTSLNVSGCVNLENLACYNTNITSLNVSNCTKLKQLYCYNTKLTSLTLTGKSQLQTLDCSNCKSLTYLNCKQCALTYLEVTGNTALQTLLCYENPNLTTIRGLANCTDLQYLDCEDCKITDLSALNSLDNLEEVLARNNKITSFTLWQKYHLTYLRLAGNTLLTTAEIYENLNLSTLNISGCTALTNLNCYGNDLTSFTVTGNTALKRLDCFGNENLETITGLADCTAITYLDAHWCCFTDMSVCNSLTNLEYLDCAHNCLTSLTITNMPKLKYVYAVENDDLTTVNINYNPALKTIHVFDCPSLQTLNCYNNALTLLLITGYYTSNRALTTLKCYNNQLDNLEDVLDLPNLETFYCYNNQLTELDLSNNNKLRDLQCERNKLTSLNVSGKKTLKILYCFNNQLTSLNVQGCSALEYISCLNNKLTSLSVQGCTVLSDLRIQVYSTSYPDDQNEITDSQIQVAYGKNWIPKRWNGSNWVDLLLTEPGDVDGNGVIGMDDLTALINYLLNGNASGIHMTGADVDGDCTVDMDDLTALINYLLTH